MLPYADRRAAGRELAHALRSYADREDALVLALPRGGVPVAREVADALHVPMDLLLVRKLGVPWQPELAFGAIAEGGARYIDEAFVRAAGLLPDQVERVIAQESDELARRADAFRGLRSAPGVRQRTVILVDDGLATGSTMEAAVRALKAQGVGRVIVAVPVGPRSTCAALQRDADEVLCLEQPEPFDAVGAWYRDFHQMTDDEVRALL